MHIVSIWKYCLLNHGMELLHLKFQIFHDSKYAHFESY